MRPRRVLQVLCDCAGGGAERVVLALATRSSSRSVHTIATVYRGGSLEPEFRASGRHIDLGARRRRPSRAAWGRLLDLVREADVVHTHLWVGDQWGRIAGRLAGHGAIVSTVHNTEGDGPLRDRIDRLTLPFAHQLVAASHAVGNRLLSAGIDATRVAVIPNGVDVRAFPDGAALAERAHKIVAIGRLTRQKGFDTLVDAAQSTPLDVTLVGEGEDRPQLGGAQLAGWHEDVRPFLRDADIVAIPSRWEGFGLVAVEAMASGRPIVASDIAPLREVLADAAVFVPPGDVHAWRKALLELSVDSERRNELRRAGLARAPMFSLEAMVARYEDLYEAVSPGSIRGG